MDRARRPTVDFFSQNLHGTLTKSPTTNLAKCRCVTGLRGRRMRTGHACGDAQTTQPVPRIVM
eukprot:6179050-Prymnesium_polylepis.1